MSRSFDGTDDFITVSTGFDSGTTHSASLWFARSSSSSDMTLIAGSDAFRYTSRLSTDGKIYYNNGGIVNSSYGTLSLNVFYNIAFTRTSRIVTFYKNAILLGSGNLGDDSTMNISLIGKEAIGNPFAGVLSHVHFYNRTLSQGEVLQIMNYPASITSGLKFYYPLFGINSPELDFSGNKNNGTVSGALFSSSNPPISSIFVIPKPRSEYASISAPSVDTGASNDLTSFTFSWG